MGDSNFTTDVSIGELLKWHKDCAEELDATYKTLDKVAKVCKECEGDDSIYGIIRKMGDGLSNVYFEAASQFKKAMEITSTIIGKYQKAVGNIASGFQSFADGFHN